MLENLKTLFIVKIFSLSYLNYLSSNSSSIFSNTNRNVLEICAVFVPNTTHVLDSSVELDISTVSPVASPTVLNLVWGLLVGERVQDLEQHCCSMTACTLNQAEVYPLKWGFTVYMKYKFS